MINFYFPGPTDVNGNMEAKAELLPYLDDSALPPGPPAGLSVIQIKLKPHRHQIQQFHVYLAPS